jgi:hypothetical protein
VRLPPAAQSLAGGDPRELLGNRLQACEDFMNRGMIIGALLLLGGSLPAEAQQAETVGRWSLTVGTGEAISTAVLPGDPEQTRLVLQCIPSPESKDLFVGVVVGFDMDFRTEGKGTFQIDANPPVVAKWAFLEKMMILNQVDQPGFNVEVMRQLAGARQFTVQSETSDGGMFTASFALDRAPEVIRRLFDACGVP